MILIGIDSLLQNKNVENPWYTTYCISAAKIKYVTILCKLLEKNKNI